MGCGGSKLDPDGEGVPARLRPLLRRRFEEIKRRRNAAILKDSTTLSKKELLKDGASDDDNSLQPHAPDDVDDHKSLSSQEDNEKITPAPDSDETATTTTTTITTATTTTMTDLKMDKAAESPLPVVPQEAETIKLEVSNPCQDNVNHKEAETPIPRSPNVAPPHDCNETMAPPQERKETMAPPQECTETMAPPQECKDTNTEKDRQDEDKEREVNAMATSTATAMAEAEVIETDGDQEEGEHSSIQDELEEDQRRLSNVEESLICPGSPSFRVYFLESLDNTKDDNKSDDTDKKSLSDQDSGETVESSVNSNEFSLERSGTNKKEGKKGRRFRRVIPKGKPVPGAVKNLLSVKSCYYPSCSGQDKARLISQKEVA